MLDEDLQMLFGTGSAVIITPLISVIKPLFPREYKYYPLLAIVLGVFWNLLLGLLLQRSPGSAIALGIVAGLTASGLYSSIKTLNRR